MLPGDFFIYKCPSCGKKAFNGSLLSGNTFGEKIYSDGKRIAPMMPEYPTITQCRKCDTLFRLVGSIGTSDFWESDLATEWGDDISVAEFLSIHGNLDAINQEFYDDNMGEIDYRIRIWHLYNDRVRKGELLFNNDDDEKIWEENLHQLLDMLDVDDRNEMIMMAEIHRNFGKFEECLSIIQSLDSPGMDWLKEKFQIKCKNQNTLVFRI